MIICSSVTLFTSAQSPLCLSVSLHIRHNEGYFIYTKRRGAVLKATRAVDNNIGALMVLNYGGKF